MSKLSSKFSFDMTWIEQKQKKKNSVTLKHKEVNKICLTIEHSTASKS